MSAIRKRSRERLFTSGCRGRTDRLPGGTPSSTAGSKRAEACWLSCEPRLAQAFAEWFTKMEKPMLVLWWVPAGHIPSAQEAKDKLAYLEQHGPTPLAFTFKKQFTVEEMLNYTATEI